ncbi:hypothetical protein [Haloechinothrix sp. LS1_15]|uniref:hypothetical protein n=1 Tax=Haloechinothrix sp. LS1_15 TaxID=2652248 RepID=UPI002944B80E|nr:hypothetical protein [Haloechinothrix sp. LS1_15]MDV6012517.1 hypothetical protein [Haloechinothrix sp. LS1_15]
MTTVTRAPSDARDLVRRLSELRTDRPAGNALLDRVREGTLSDIHLKRLVAMEYTAQRTELTCFGALIARFPFTPAADFYTWLAQLVSAARPALLTAARALGLSEPDMRRWPDEPAAYAFADTLSWISLNGSLTASALAVHSDVTVYFPACADLTEAASDAGVALPESLTGLYTTAPPGDLTQLAVAVAQRGLDRGDDPEEAVCHAWRLEESLERFWQAAADAPAR